MISGRRYKQENDTNIYIPFRGKHVTFDKERGGCEGKSEKSYDLRVNEVNTWTSKRTSINPKCSCVCMSFPYVILLSLALNASSPGVPPYYMMVCVALWDRCTAPRFASFPRRPALKRRLGRRQEGLFKRSYTGVE